MIFTILVVDSVEIVTIDGPRAALWGRRHDVHYYFGSGSTSECLVDEKIDAAMFLQFTSSIYHKWQICNVREIKNCSSSMQVNFIEHFLPKLLLKKLPAKFQVNFNQQTY
jgi:hypothetical protein